MLAILLVPLAAAHETGVPHEEPQVCGPSEPGAEGDWLFLIPLAAGIGLLLLTQLTAVPFKSLLALLALLFLIGGMWVLWVDLEINQDTIRFGAPGSAHLHADFQLMLNNQIVDLTDERYLSIQGQMLSDYVHLHHVDSVVHVHAENVTWRYFFKTINVPVDDECLRLRNESVCNATFIVNGERIGTLDTPISDGDRALFHYGGGNALGFFEEAVGNESCLYSHTCPERGFYTDCAVTE